MEEGEKKVFRGTVKQVSVRMQCFLWTVDSHALAHTHFYSMQVFANSMLARCCGSQTGSLKGCTFSFSQLSHSTPLSFSLSLFQDLQAATVNPDPSLKEFEGATLRYASLKLRCVCVGVRAKVSLYRGCLNISLLE